jgi:WD40 repeat protein
LASGSEDNTVKLWSVESQKEVTRLRGHSHYVYSVAFSSDGKYLASGSYDKTVKLWSIENFQEISSL